MFDADVISDERAVIGPAQEGRPGGIGVAGGMVELVFEVEVNAHVDLTQLSQADNPLCHAFRFLSRRDHHADENSE